MTQQQPPEGGDTELAQLAEQVLDMGEWMRQRAHQPAAEEAPAEATDGQAAPPDMNQWMRDRSAR